MDRREFIKWTAILCAGMAAAPTQIEAFEYYYFINSPKTPGPLILIDDVWAAGLASRSMPIHFNIWSGVDGRRLPLGLNVYGGFVRWIASPDQKIMTHPKDFNWEIKAHLPEDQELLEINLSAYIKPVISYIDQEGIRWDKELKTLTGTLG